MQQERRRHSAARLVSGRLHIGESVVGRAAQVVALLELSLLYCAVMRPLRKNNAAGGRLERRAARGTLRQRRTYLE